MKKIILFILIISNLAFAEDCSWKWVNPLPQGNNLNYVQFVNNDVCYSTGDNGTLLKSIDKGLSWNLIKTEMVSIDFSFFFDENKLLLIDAKNGIAKYQDGNEVLYEKAMIIPKLEYSSFHFFDLNKGYCYSKTDSIMLKTTNCGDSWDTIYIPSKNKYRSNLFFFNDNNILFADKNTLLKTTDGGANWKFKNTLPDTTIGLIHFLDENTGWISNLQGELFKTTDGSESWTEQFLNKNSFPLFYFKFFDENNGYVFGWDNYLYRTTDGGENWEMQTLKELMGGGQNSLSISDERVIIGVENDGVIKRTVSNGYSWDSISTGTLYEMSDVHFINDTTGWAISKNKLILKTTDAGTTWVNQKYKNKARDYFIDIHFFNENTGILSDRAGYFYKTTNAGAEWTQISEISDVSIHDIYFVNEQVGYVAYWSSSVNEFFVKKTTEGGNYWDHCKAFADTSIDKLHFLNENLGYTASKNGIFIKTTDGGKNWTTKIIDSTLKYNQVYFIDENTGWFVTNLYYHDSNWVRFDSIVVQKTTDGGESWVLQLYAEGTYTNMQFLNENYGWIITEQGYTFKTTDGGNNWEKLPSATNKYLSFLHIISEEKCRAFGKNGLVMEYNCEQTSIEEPLPFSESTDIQIFPNPATNEITLSIPEEQNINSISIFNSLGMEVKRIEQTKLIGNCKITISTADLPNGLYHCSIVNQSGSVTKSFVVVR